MLNYNRWTGTTVVWKSSPCQVTTWLFLLNNIYSLRCVCVCDTSTCLKYKLKPPLNYGLIKDRGLQFIAPFPSNGEFLMFHKQLREQTSRPSLDLLKTATKSTPNYALACLRYLLHLIRCTKLRMISLPNVQACPLQMLVPFKKGSMLVLCKCTQRW